MIRSKAPITIEEYGENYMAIGPYFPHAALPEFEPQSPPDNIVDALKVIEDKLNIKCTTFSIQFFPSEYVSNFHWIIRALRQMAYSRISTCPSLRSGVVCAAPERCQGFVCFFFFFAVLSHCVQHQLFLLYGLGIPADDAETNTCVVFGFQVFTFLQGTWIWWLVFW